MYKQVKKKKLGRKKSHRDSLIRNLLRSLFESNSLVTTTSKAKELKREASSLILKGKKDKLSFRRKLENIFGRSSLVKKFEEYVEKDNAGVGIVKVGFRDGDNAEQSRVYLLGIEKKKAKKEESEEKETKKVKVEEKKKVVMSKDKKVDTTATIRKAERARSRSGI